MEIANKQAKNKGIITQEELEEILIKHGEIKYEEDGKTIKGITTSKEKYEIAIEDIYNGKTKEGGKKLATQVIKPENYGDEVEYSANGVENWKIFLNDGTNIYIIASDYVPRSGMILETGIEAGEGDYGVKGNSQSNLVNWLKDTSKWSKYANGISGLVATATGGVTIEQFVKSYNNKNGTNYSENAEQGDGFITNITDILYNPHVGSGWSSCYGYWLASSCTRYASAVWIMYCDSNRLFTDDFSVTDIGIRPLVCLPTESYVSKGTNNKWTFSK